MIILDEKKTKKFIKSLTLIINSVSKYNVETVWMLQLAIDYKNQDLEPIVICKDNGVDTLNYLHIMAKDETFKNEMFLLKNTKNRISNDMSLASPIVIAGSKPEVFTAAHYSDTFFIVGDSFKEFMKTNTVNTIDEELNFYNMIGEKMSISHFIYPNDIEATFNTNELVKKMSPKRLFGNERSFKYFLKDFWFNNDNLYEMFSKLRELLNSEDKTYLIEGEELQTISEELKKSNSMELSRYYKMGAVSATLPSIYSDFYRINPLSMYVVYYPDMYPTMEAVQVLNTFINLTNKNVSINVCYRNFGGKE